MMDETRESKEVDVARIVAGEMYQTDEVDIPADASVQWAEGGCWVQAYVWVSDENRGAVSGIVEGLPL
jgi:hypothetical protein